MQLPASAQVLSHQTTQTTASSVRSSLRKMKSKPCSASAEDSMMTDLGYPSLRQPILPTPARPRPPVQRTIPQMTRATHRPGKPAWMMCSRHQQPVPCLRDLLSLCPRLLPPYGKRPSALRHTLCLRRVLVLPLTSQAIHSHRKTSAKRCPLHRRRRSPQKCGDDLCLLDSISCLPCHRLR